MKKTTIALAVAGAMFAAGSAFAEGVTIDGYASVDWLLTNEADETQEGQFSVSETEVNFDTEHLFVEVAGSDTDSFSIGQAFVKYGITEGWDMKAGLFDSNLTADYGAATDREFVQHSLLFSVLDGVGGASLKGVAVSGQLGMATVTLGYGNDTSVTPDNTATPAVDGENSMMLMVNASPMEGLDLEFGMLTQDEDGVAEDPLGNTIGASGTLMDINGTYMIQGFTVGLDYLSASDAEAGEFDNGYSFWAGYDFGNGFGVKARFDNASFDGVSDDLEATELYASYALNDNLAVAVSLSNLDNGTTDADINTIQLVGTF